MLTVYLLTIILVGYPAGIITKDGEDVVKEQQIVYSSFYWVTSSSEATERCIYHKQNLIKVQNIREVRCKLTEFDLEKGKDIPINMSPRGSK